MRFVREKKRFGRAWWLSACCALLVLALLWLAADAIAKRSSTAAMDSLERAVREGCASCYALEGRYPPDLAYLQARYGVILNRRFIVQYRVFAENLMPDITVYPVGEVLP